MKRKIITVIICLLILLIAPLALVSSSFWTSAVFSGTYYGELYDMYQRIQDSSRKKIVIIGNSSVPFGVDSELMEKELGYDQADYKVCNFGLYGAIGTKVMLDLSEEYINKDDIVIFSPELDSQSLSLYFSAGEFLRACDGHFEMLKKIKGDHSQEIVGAVPSFGAEKFKYNSTGTKPDAGSIYSHEAFNENCNMVKSSRPYNKMTSGCDANNPIVFDQNLFSADFIAYVNDYYRTVKAKGASMFYAFAPMNARGIKTDSPFAQDQLASFIDSSFSFPLLNSPSSAVMEYEWFFDSNFHLNSSGMTMHTISLLRDLKNQFGLTTPVHETEPTKPVIPASETGSGDNTFLDSFLYAKDGEAYKITGLTEKGQEQTEITIPYSYEGVGITSFDASVFKNDAYLVNVTIQDNIRYLADASFSGCSKLQSIIIKQEDPEKIGVGFNFLSGAPDCLIYVPFSSLSLYSTDYFWGHYAGYLKGN